ncbi:MAG: hypothetical protein IJ841_02245 [Prevotella sp.]|nr:hypothetical protein [Prevotella sp.]
MTKLFTLTIRTSLALRAFLLLPATVAAQDLAEQVGYTNVYVRLQVADSNSGRVSATPPSGGLDSYKEVVEFQKTLPVASLIEIVYFNAKFRVNSGYTFVGWYADNGDGIFDLDNDELFDNSREAMIYFPISMLGLTEDDIYETEAEAKAAYMPTKPQLVLWAYATNGATAEPDYKMGMGDYDFKMGTVEISKPINNPGDVVTITATPSEGFQFEYWKTGYDSQWGTSQPNTIVSRDQSFTFTVQGGEHYYAYFSAIDAPVIELPEEGGWYVGAFDKVWALHELSDAFVFVPSLTDVDDNGAPLFDIVTDAQNRSYMDLSDEYAKRDNTFHFMNTLPGFGNQATLIYGKGTVRFTHDRSSWVTFDREGNMLQWSGSTGYTIKDPQMLDFHHVYAFRPDLGAFVKIGTTDMYYEEATTQVFVPAQTCYIDVSGQDIADPNTGYIPDIIALTPELFDQAVASVDGAKVKPISVKGTRMYTLGGVEVKSAAEKGVYIVNGKKVFINK